MLSTEDQNKEVTLHRLGPTTVKLLSSGQVITSVSTAVKELLENSIDANAKNIEIKLENEGFDKIEVKDNGNGIRCDDVPYMCKKRYTSKIRDFSDLDHLNSYGFRGEALSSLCAISQVTIITKTQSDDLATSYTFNSEGEIISSQTSHLSIGTVVTIQGLFKNLPVRKQYLTGGKRKAHELKAVGDIVKSFGLIHPKLRIVLSHNKFVIWQKSSVNNIKESLVQIIPVTVAKHLHEIIYSDNDIEFHLMIPSKECHVWNTCYGINIDSTNLFINLRPVKNKQIEKLVLDQINQYFGSTIPQNKTPFCLISITLPTDRVDVNLEPNKTKVIIRNLEYVTKVLVDKLILYYFGVLEPPKPNINEDEIIDTNLKRKSIETPTKIKITNSCITPRKRKRESKDSLNEESNSLVVNNVESTDVNNMNESSGNFETSAMESCQIEMDENDSSINWENCLDVIDKELLKVEQDNIKGKKFDDKVDDGITVCIEDVKGSSSKGYDEVGIISDEEDSVDSFTEEILENIRNDFETSGKEETNKTSTENINNNLSQKNQESLEENSNSELNINDITLSQWSRGNVKFNGKTVKSSTVVGKQEEQIKKDTESLTCSSIESNTQENLMDRSVSSQMGCKELSAFTKFAREMRSKIIEQKPGMTFTTVAAELATKWRSLHDEDKQIYEQKAKEEKENRIRTAKMSMVKIKDPPYKFKPITRYNPPTIPKKKYITSIDIDLSIDKLKLSLDKRIKYQPDEFNLISTIEENLLLLRENNTIILASINRLKEATSLYDNLDQMKIQSRFLDNRIPINLSDLNPELWNLMDSLETCFDNTFNTIIVISDERITKNGFRIEKIPGAQENKYYITDVPQGVEDINMDDIKEILNFININKSVKLRDCRPLKILNFIKIETLKQGASFISLNDTNVMDLFKFWSQNVRGMTKNCPHFRPVCKILFPINQNFSL